MKYDGHRMQAQLIDGIGPFLSINDIDWSNNFPHLLHALEQFEVSHTIFDEVVVLLHDQAKSHFQELQYILKSKKDKPLPFYVFDLLYLNGKDLRHEPALKRKKILKDLLLGSTDSIRFSDHLRESGHRFYDLSYEYGLEGVFPKLLDSPYFSSRNDLWVKAKCSQQQEFVIAGWTEAQDGRSHFGPFLLGVYERGRLRYVGRVGTGFTEKSLREVFHELSSSELKSKPFDNDVPYKRGVHWGMPVKVCEVSFANWTQDRRLRAPVFSGNT